MKSIKISTMVILLTLLLVISIMAEEVTLPGNFHKAYIYGSVTSDGKQLTDVIIMAIKKEGGNVSSTNASNGNYALGAGEGTWSINVMKDGYFMEKELTVSLSGEEAKEINIEMKKSSAIIKGQVVDESNNPIPEAMVTGTLSYLGEKEGKSFVPGMGFKAKCDGKGYFSLSTTKGNFLIMAFKMGYELSEKNPLPESMKKMMENVPQGMNFKMPSMGVEVTVAEGETKNGVIIILKPAESSEQKFDPNEFMNKMLVDDPKVNVLTGKAINTPNNVLHWTRKENQDQKSPYVPYIIVRSTRDFSDKGKGEIKEITFGEKSYGIPQNSYYSFTDSTAVSGQTYWYKVCEKGKKGNGPYSNSVKITTK